MTAKVFIDGEVGTTGLQIKERLEGRSDIELLHLDENDRKDPDRRREVLNEADLQHRPGAGRIVVNGKDHVEYFARPVLQMILKQPINAVERADQYDVNCTVKGGGLSGQAGAVRHGISKALTLYEPELRGVLKKGGFLTRDSRVVERKKYGKAKARRSFQFSKR